MNIDSIADIYVFQWLIGTWSEAAGDRITTETWVRIDDQTLSAEGKTVKSGKTVFEEKLTIQITNEGIYYIADVAHNSEPVWFKLTLFSSGEAVFENRQHDFPQKLHYKLLGDAMYVEIEGLNKDGKTETVNIVYRRS